MFIINKPPAFAVVVTFYCLVIATHGFLTPYSKGVLPNQLKGVGPLGASVKTVDSFDGSFTLPTETEQLLIAYLKHPDMIKEVSKQAKSTEAEFTGQLFQPVPYSPGTPHGMPRDMEQFHNHPEFAIINIPPIIMFKAKVFKPSRLCAIYAVKGRSPEEKQRLLELSGSGAGGNEGVRPGPSILSVQADDKAWATVGSSLRKTMQDFTGPNPVAADDDDDDDVDLDSMVV